MAKRTPEEYAAIRANIKEAALGLLPQIDRIAAYGEAGFVVEQELPGGAKVSTKISDEQVALMEADLDAKLQTIRDMVAGI